MIGTVYVLKQIHQAVSANADGELTVYESVGKRMLTGIHQLAIASAIRNLGVTAIFSEGQSTQIPESSWDPGSYRDFLCDSLARGAQVPLLLENLYRNGAPEVAGSCFGLPLYPTQTTATSRQVNEYLAGRLQFRSRTERDAFIYANREREALYFVRNYLQLHPGERVSIVFGAGHGFGEDVVRSVWPDPQRAPRIVMVDFPSSAAFAVNMNDGNIPPCAQGDLVRQAEVIPLGAIESLDSPEMRRLALTKLDPFSLSDWLDLDRIRRILQLPGGCLCLWTNAEFERRYKGAEQEVDDVQVRVKNDLALQVSRLHVPMLGPAEVQKMVMKPLPPLIQVAVADQAKRIPASAVPFFAAPNAQVQALRKLEGSCDELLDVPAAAEMSGMFVSVAFSQTLEEFRTKVLQTQCRQR